MRLLIDTNILLWTLAGSSRVETVKDLIMSKENLVFVSAASWWEIAIKSATGKLQADVKSLRAASLASGFFDLPILGVHTEALNSLSLLHKDPFDRMIVCQAMTEPMRLLTGDRQLGAYSELVQTI